MFTRRSFGALALITALGIGSVAAQESAVVVLRSGERVNGSIIDMGARGYQVRVNGTDRWITGGQIAAISFGGDVTDAQFDVVSSGNAVIVLRNGQRVTGELYDISGTTPLKLTLRNNNGEREINSSEVARIIFARPTAAGAVAAPVDPGAGAGPGVVVAADQQWISTGITVRRGQTVQFQSTGQVRISGDQRDLANINGSLNQRYAPNSPLPQFLAGALIGRVGNGTPFAVGSQTSVEMPDAGILYLAVNDDSQGDNAGHFNVIVTPVGRTRR
ncbi:MAG: hypothetical protein M3Q55_12770 [Acidobacteriota bacterium]|nr:hypothetical protein [Acidobacteriota bacterium]